MLVGSLYNEIEPFAATWLEKLVERNLISAGRVDRRSIADLSAADCAGTQAHFFAGIGGWSHALRLAGWPDDVPAWTGSCPCQPFSSAGRKGGFDDARHLWPTWFKLIEQCRPPIIFGEQVASPDGLKWLDIVSSNLEAAGYAFGAADLCAAGIGAPHIRQRLYFVAVTNGERRERLGVQLRERRSQQTVPEVGWSSTSRILADADGARLGARGASETSDGRDETRLEPTGLRDAGIVDHTGGERSRRHAGAVSGTQGESEGQRLTARDLADVPLVAGATHGVWAEPDWLACRDGKWRPVEPGTFPVAHGVSGRMGRLRGYGNAIVPPLAATFVRAVMEDLWQN
jgi:DNA (cytosine-5)-methyltransferase 1